MAKRTWVTAFAVEVLLLLTVCGRSDASSNKVRDDIFSGYDKHDYPGDVIVEAAMTFISCPTLNSNGILSYHVKEHYNWNDRRLRWNPADYSDTTSISVTLKHLWVPDMKLSSPDDDVTGLASQTELVAEVKWNGEVSVHRHSHYRTRCFDAPQSDRISDCSLRFGSIDAEFKVAQSSCNTDMFGQIADQCRNTILSRSTEIDYYRLNEDGPTTYWYLVELRILKKSQHYFFNV